MKDDYPELGENETRLAIQAAIEGLTVEELMIRELTELGFSKEVAKRLTRVGLLPTEENWNRLQRAMRELGWADEQVEVATQQLLDTIDGAVDRTLSNLNVLPAKEKP